MFLINSPLRNGTKTFAVSGDTTYKNCDKRGNMEFLKEILTEELYTSLEDALKDKDVKLANLTDGNYVCREKYQALENEIATLKKGAETNEAMISELEELKKEKKTAELNRHLKEEGVKNPELISRFLNGEEEISVQIKALKDSYPYLFSEETPCFTGKVATSNTTKMDFSKMNYAERVKLYLENPSLYNEFTK